MSTELATQLDNANYDQIAAMSGLTSETSARQSTLGRLKVNSKAIMGEEEVKGKVKKVEVVGAGTYQVELSDGTFLYAESAELHPYMQRYMYKRFIKGDGKVPNKYVKTVMGDNLNIDLKDTSGGFNCGKPAGYIKDFKALPESVQTVIKQTKRTRVVFGVVYLKDAVNAAGESVDASEGIPVIWEIDNRDAFKDVGEVFEQFAKKKVLPVTVKVGLTTKEVPLPNGESYYLPVVDLDFSNQVAITQDVQDNFKSFLEWIEYYNKYVFDAWSTSNTADDDELDDVSHELVDEIVGFDDDEEAA